MVRLHNRVIATLGACAVSLVAFTTYVPAADMNMKPADDMHINSSADMAMGHTVMVGGAAMYPTKNIIENAMNSKDHTTLVAAVKAAGLVDTLQGTGPFTVFAPTNEAFGKLPAGTVDGVAKTVFRLRLCVSRHRQEKIPLYPLERRLDQALPRPVHAIDGLLKQRDSLRRLPGPSVCLRKDASEVWPSQLGARCPPHIKCTTQFRDSCLDLPAVREGAPPQQHPEHHELIEPMLGRQRDKGFGPFSRHLHVPQAPAKGTGPEQGISQRRRASDFLGQRHTLAARPHGLVWIAQPKERVSAVDTVDHQHLHGLVGKGVQALPQWPFEIECLLQMLPGCAQFAQPVEDDAHCFVAHEEAPCIA